MIDIATTKVIIANATHSKAVAELAKPIGDYMGTAYFSYMQVHSSGQMRIVCNNKSWLRYYFNNKFYQYDPHIVHPSQMLSGFTLWNSTEENLHYNGKVLFAAHELFDFNCGASLIKKHDDYYEVFMFNGRSANKYKVYAKYFNRKFCLEYFADYFRKQGSKIIKALPEFNIAEFKSTFNSQKGIIATRMPEPFWAKAG